jgi:hypothetical protein
MLTVPPRRILAALVLVAVAGVVRLPFEQARARELQARGILEPPLSTSLRDELGQSFFIAVLGGFRSVVASLVELKTIRPWQEGQWGLVDEYYAVCNRLQPREWHYWDLRAWHAGVNAGDSYQYETAASAVVRTMKTRQAFAKAIAVTEEGIRYNPDVYQLYERMHLLQTHQLNPAADYLAASRACERGAECPGAPSYLRRFSAYHLAEVPGHELEAWRRMMALYTSGDPLNRAPGLVIRLAVLHPKVSQLDPSALLPSEIASQAVRLRAAWKESRAAAERRRVELHSPSLPLHRRP